ncbi:MFS transporter [soil metagenome]
MVRVLPADEQGLRQETEARDGRGTLVRARVSVSAAFFLFAAVLGNWAARVPAIKQGLGLDDGGLGVALLGLAAGFIVGTRLAPGVMDNLGSALVLRVSTGVFCLSLVAPALAASTVWLTIALGLVGVAGGVCDVSLNAQAVLVERRYGRPIISGFHALFSVGGMAAGAVGAGAAALGMTPLVHFSLAAAALFILSLVSLHRLSPGDRRSAESTRDEGDQAVSAASLPVLLLGLISFASFVGEGSAGDWSAVYLRETLGAPAGVAALGFTAFSGAMAACRFLSDRLVARLGAVAIARAGSIVAAGGLAIGLVAGNVAAGIAGFALLGAGLAPVVPLAFSAAGNTGPRASSKILGRVVMMGYLGSIFGPVVIGFTADALGLRAALFLPVGLALVAAACASRVGAAGVVVTAPAGGSSPGPESAGVSGS